MLLPPFRWGRGTHVSTGSRIARLRAVITAAQALDLYRDRLTRAKLATPAQVSALRDADAVLATLPPISYQNYCDAFTMRRPSWRQRPEGYETRSALMLPYPEARAGIGNCRAEPPLSAELYSPTGMARAVGDLYRLSRALQTPAGFDWRSDHALVVFSGMDAGVLTADQRDRLWQKYPVPIFEQFVGTDGRVLASECEVHAGLHLRMDDGILECLDGEIVVTSLTDLEAPALRIRSGLSGSIQREMCDCGRAEPRLVQVQPLGQRVAAVAVA